MSEPSGKTHLLAVGGEALNITTFGGELTVSSILQGKTETSFHKDAGHIHLIFVGSIPKISIDAPALVHRVDCIGVLPPANLAEIFPSLRELHIDGHNVVRNNYLLIAGCEQLQVLSITGVKLREFRLEFMERLKSVTIGGGIDKVSLSHGMISTLQFVGEPSVANVDCYLVDVRVEQLVFPWAVPLVIRLYNASGLGKLLRNPAKTPLTVLRYVHNPLWAQPESECWVTIRDYD